jgi:tRNA-Thr(GGU) m(6)t(6)A37 methyltransferase TsaA
MMRTDQGDESMNETTRTLESRFMMKSIGTVRRSSSGIRLEIDESFRPALRQLGSFSHVMVFWWAGRNDNDEYRGMLQTRPPYAEEHLTGVFATRSPYRPNPVAMTTCRLESVDEDAGFVEVADIDAFDGTQIVDLKAYFPVCDRVKTAHIPAWLSDWPDWMPDDGIGLEPWEEE